jgi:hypothetical protein
MMASPAPLFLVDCRWRRTAAVVLAGGVSQRYSPLASSMMASPAPLFLVECRWRCTAAVVHDGAASYSCCCCSWWHFTAVIVIRLLSGAINERWGSHEDSAEKNLQTCQHTPSCNCEATLGRLKKRPITMESDFAPASIL